MGKKTYEKYERYTVYLKTSYGYCKFSANWKKVAAEEKNVQPVSIEQLLITEDKDEDFSSCKEWD